MKLFLDDVRDCPEGFTLCRTVGQAKHYLFSGKVVFISFDHDLGENQSSGYDLATFIENLVYYKLIKCPDWDIHSANPVGRKNIAAAMNNAWKFANN